MKLRHILVLLMVILLIGCAKKEVAPEPTPVAPEPTPVVEPETAPEPEPVVTEPKPVEKPQELTKEETELLGDADVALTKAGFNPDKVTISAGGNLVIKVLDDNRHAVSSKNSDIFRSGSLTKAEETVIPLKDAGSYLFMDVTYGKRLTVEVTE